MKYLFILLLIIGCGAPVSNPQKLTHVDPTPNPNVGGVVEISPSHVTLAWDESPEGDIEGYRLHYGTSSRAYSVHKNIGGITENTINGLSPGVPYFFAVTAYDKDGLESDYSDEIEYTPSASQIAWEETVEIPRIVNQTFSFARDPEDGLTYFYAHFQWLGKPRVKYRVQYKLDLNEVEWTDIEVFNLRPGPDPFADRTIYATYRYYPVPITLFFRVVP